MTAQVTKDKMIEKKLSPAATPAASSSVDKQTDATSATCASTSVVKSKKHTSAELKEMLSKCGKLADLKVRLIVCIHN